MSFHLLPDNEESRHTINQSAGPRTCQRAELGVSLVLLLGFSQHSRPGPALPSRVGLQQGFSTCSHLIALRRLPFERWSLANIQETQDGTGGVLRCVSCYGQDQLTS